MHKTFEPFERVLVRNYNDNEWICNLYSHYHTRWKEPHVCTWSTWKYCIPYAGNEHLLGTTDSPEPKHEYKWGEIVEVQCELEKKWRKAVFIKREGDTFWCIANDINRVTMWDCEHVRPLKED